MKKCFAVLLCLCLLCSLWGCSSGGSEGTESLFTQYYNYAKSLADSGDYEKAVAVLEEGIAATGSEALKLYMEQIAGEAGKAQPEEESIPSATAAADGSAKKTPQEIADLWCTVWTTENSSLENGSFIIDSEWYGDPEVYFVVEYTSAAPMSRVATFETELQIADLQGHQLLITFDDDGWGNSGKCLLTHQGDKLVCKIYDVVSADADWGFTEGEYTLTENVEYWLEQGITQ